MSPSGPSTASTGAPRAAEPSSRRVLVVGPAQAPFPLADTIVVHTLFVHLSRRLLDKVQPDTILAPLIAGAWDILDLVEVLHRHGYKGPVLVQTRRLPRADLVLREIGGLYPGVSLAFVELSD
jgi:hypothetical protein